MMLDRFKFRAWSKEKLECMIPYEMLRDATGGMTKALNAIGIVEDEIPKGLFLPFEDEDLIFMQCTGIKDKNGQLIFEGDIYHQGDKELTYTVVHSDASFKGRQNKCYGSYAGLSHWSDRIEVIGNIHENPELLEELQND